MKKITVPKTKLFADSQIYYVPSKSGGDKHIVVRAKSSSHSSVYFCDCKDFMTRRLPTLGTPDFTLCSHGRRVQDKIRLDRIKHEGEGKSYGVFTPNGYRSSDIPGTYLSLEAAREAIDAYEFKNGHYGRVARAL